MDPAKQRAGRRRFWSVETERGIGDFEKQRVDVMFTDIRMPKMDGLTLVNKMEELSQKPVVIVLSGYDEFSYAVEMMKHGVRDYILKPIKRETIEQLLENLERELSETRETEEEEERCFLNQLRYLMMNAEMAEEKNGWIWKAGSGATSETTASGSC